MKAIRDMHPLSFSVLRHANAARLPQFKNSKGGLAHSERDGSDWSVAQWLQALVGELGEFANLRKKFERGDLTFEEYACEAEKELADVATYLDILARRALDCGQTPHTDGIDLGAAIVKKFNAVSERVGSDVGLHEELNAWTTQNPSTLNWDENHAD